MRRVRHLITNEGRFKSSFCFLHKINMDITLTKPKAKQRIEISPDYKMDPNGWFHQIKFVEKKTGKIRSTHCVIEKDLDNWIRGFVSEGWIVELQSIN